MGLRYESLFPEFEAQKGVDHRVIPWQDVQSDEGTGIVHIAPGCGREDFALSKEHGLDVIVPINEDGIYDAGFGFLSDRHVTEALEPVCERLKETGRLYATEEYAHRYPRC